jgi:hypothetical protein
MFLTNYREAVDMLENIISKLIKPFRASRFYSLQKPDSSWRCDFIVGDDLNSHCELLIAPEVESL